MARYRRPGSTLTSNNFGKGLPGRTPQATNTGIKKQVGRPGLKKQVGRPGPNKQVGRPGSNALSIAPSTPGPKQTGRPYSYGGSGSYEDKVGSQGPDWVEHTYDNYEDIVNSVYQSTFGRPAEFGEFSHGTYGNKDVGGDIAPLAGYWVDQLIQGAHKDSPLYENHNIEAWLQDHLLNSPEGQSTIQGHIGDLYGQHGASPDWSGAAGGLLDQVQAGDFIDSGGTWQDWLNATISSGPIGQGVQQGTTGQTGTPIADVISDGIPTIKPNQQQSAEPLANPSGVTLDQVQPYLSSLYNTFFDRDIKDKGLNYWLGEVQKHADDQGMIGNKDWRSWLADSIKQSPEFGKIYSPVQAEGGGKWDDFLEFLTAINSMGGMFGGGGYPGVGYGGFSPGGVAGASNPYGQMINFMNAFKGIGDTGTGSTANRTTTGNLNVG